MKDELFEMLRHCKAVGRQARIMFNLTPKSRIGQITKMRKSMEELVERAFDIKCHLSLRSYELHHFDDGSYVDFRPNRINDPRTLCLLAGQLPLEILCIEGGIVVRLFEDFKEY